MREQVKCLQHQLDWFKKQLFGPKSERQVFDLAEQGELFQATDASTAQASQAPQEEEKRSVRSYQRGTAKKQRDEDCLNATGLRFTADVPVQVVQNLPPELTGPNADQYEIIGTKTTYRLAQQAASYLVIQHERPVFRLNLVKRSIDLLRPIVDAQTDSILRSRVLAMDETPIKAGHQKRPGAQKGKMKSGWFWPMYGDADEVVFTYSNSRGKLHIEQVLKSQFSGTLISDGYAAYARYAAAQKNITHAQCWVHSRRYFIEAQKEHPEKATEALQQIAKLYQNEATIKKLGLSGQKKHQYRQDHTKPLVSNLFQWCQGQLENCGLLPSDPLSKALNYVLKREASLSVFLEDPDVQPDTNHLERTLRPIPLGRKNWLFCWTELGAEHLGIIQSLISTCKLHDLNPYTYLVDVLQRISQHPASKVNELTPRLWKERFADNPLRALIDPHHPQRQSSL